MSAILGVVAAPLRKYLTQTLQFYLSKYFQDINVEGLGVFGSDLVFENLEIRRDVLLETLKIPPIFDIKVGFIKELRIKIPWTQLLSKPIEVQLHTIECILTTKDATARGETMKRSGSKSELSAPQLDDAQFSAPPAAAAAGQPPGQHDKSWMGNMLRKILANISVSMQNVVFKYEADDVVLSITAGAIEVSSACPAEVPPSLWSARLCRPRRPPHPLSLRQPPPPCTRRLSPAALHPGGHS